MPASCSSALAFSGSYSYLLMSDGMYFGLPYRQLTGVAAPLYRFSMIDWRLIAYIIAWRNFGLPKAGFLAGFMVIALSTCEGPGITVALALPLARSTSSAVR